MSTKKTKAGKLTIQEMKKLANKKVGFEVAWDLQDENPTEVTEWIPTGCRWLDSIICRGQMGGIPVGKITEIAGLESSGKSYMASVIAANAQKMGMDVVYFDSESAVDPKFLQKIGIDLSRFLYIQATSVETVLSLVEEYAPNGNLLFIWDSVALTPTEKDIEGDFNPQSSMAMKARVLSKGMQKLVVPIANNNCSFLVLNQLKTNITSNMAEALTTPFFTPGGKTLPYTYSLRIWLTARKAKASKIFDDKGFQIGSEHRATLKKSRFGTANRACNYKILWAGNVIGIQDEESWLDAIKGSDALSNAGAWYTLKSPKGDEFKFQTKQWLEKLQEPEFRQAVLDVMDEEVIMKFERREGEASKYYEEEEG